MKSYIKYAGLALLVTVISVVIYAALKPDQYHTPERIAWKNRAIKELEVIGLKYGKPALDYTHEGWLSPEGLIMEDGSWMAYRSSYHEGIYDIFIGRASNNKWYYSSSHICVRIEEVQPESLPEFINQHSLVEFDGSSDDCLLSTWSPKNEPGPVDYIPKVIVILVVLLVVAVICKIRLRSTAEE